MSKVKFFPHTADIEFEVYGNSMKQAFENAATVVANTITETKKVNAKIKKEISVSSEDLQSLLYDFLEQILILHDSENLVFSKIKVKKIVQEKKKYALNAEFFGEQYDEKKHGTGTVVKAITYHSMEIGKKKIAGKEMYFVHLVIDI